jgi:DNA polymerase I-like protein with 3'-5' exonuclease and polymerase domains
MKPEVMSQLPSNWRPTNVYPNLVGRAKEFSIDLETYDPNLLDNGPGALRKDGHIIGFSVACDGGYADYFPIRHDGDNVENPEMAIRWLRDQMADSTPKIGANILYDLIWLKADLNIDVKGPKWDVQVAEPLIDENSPNFKLDTLGVKWLGIHKDEDLLLQAGIKLLGLRPAPKCGDTDEEKKKSIITQVKGNLWRLPARYVGPYGVADADLPIKIFELQRKRLTEDGQWPLFEIEAEVLDLLFEMWMQGVPVDLDRAQEARDMLQAEYVIAMGKLRNKTGFDVDVWSGDSLEKMCKTLGLAYETTDKGNPSFTAAWLEAQEHDVFKMVKEARVLDRNGAVFIQKKIIDLAVNGRIHPQFWQVKNDKNGTGSGRFASSNPNAQQFPARNERMAKLVRGLVIPEAGCEWCCQDYSQQEPRVTIHYGYICGFAGAAEARQKFIDDPSTDYHQMTADMADVERKPAKTINLGLTYGMGKKKLAEQLGLSMRDANILFSKYHDALPYIKLLTESASRLAGERGYVKTLLGRRCHFDLYGPPKWSPGLLPLKYDEAIAKFGRPVNRYFLHKALNRIIQGSSADMIKVAMVLCRRAGFIPHLTVHDENDYSIQNRKDAQTIHDIMVHDTAKFLKLEVPLKVDIEVGPNWGECVKIN